MVCGRCGVYISPPIQHSNRVDLDIGAKHVEIQRAAAMLFAASSELLLYQFRSRRATTLQHHHVVYGTEDHNASMGKLVPNSNSRVYEF